MRDPMPRSVIGFDVIDVVDDVEVRVRLRDGDSNRCVGASLFVARAQLSHRRIAKVAVEWTLHGDASRVGVCSRASSSARTRRWNAAAGVVACMRAMHGRNSVTTRKATVHAAFRLTMRSVKAGLARQRERDQRGSRSVSPVCDRTSSRRFATHRITARRPRNGTSKRE